MRETPLAALLFVGQLCMGQDDGTKGIHDGRWSIGVSGSVDHCFRELRNTGSDPNADLIIGLLDQHEQPDIGWSVGLDLSRRLGRHWSVLAGVHFCERGYRSELFNDFIAVDPVENDPAIPLSSRYTHHFGYLEVPLLGMYSLGSGRLQGIVAVGLRPGYLVSAEERIRNDYGNGETKDIRRSIREGKREFSLMAVASMGAACRIGSRLDIRLMPEARYGMMSVLDGDVKKNLWSVGATIGALYRF